MHHTFPPRRYALIAALAGGMGLALALAGCNIVGPASYLVAGPQQTPAMHKLADVPTVIFVDDRRTVVNPTSLRRVIADRAGEILMEKKQLTTVIGSQDVIALTRQTERHDKILSLEEIGKAVGAKQVIAVEMLQFDDFPPDRTPRPVATCRIKVIDVETRTRTFPPAELEESWHPLSITTREVDPNLYMTRAGRTQVRESLAQETAERIAKVFYKHETTELGGNLKPR